MPIDFASSELTELSPKIAVIGVGGAGCNAVNNMISAELQGVDFMVANTDAQSLSASQAASRLQLGIQITQGLGAGAQPKIGEAAAEEAIDKIEELLEGVHMAFITAGMGGGTGTGAAPIIAKRAREKGILTVGVVTKPFQFEGLRRMKVADAGIEALQQHVDTLIIIPNQNLFRVANERTTFADAFAMADEVLHSGVRGITDLMVMPGLINLDFADVRTVMSEMGKAMMGTGEAEGEGRALMAAEAAISNPLLDEVSLRGASGVIINVTGGMDMTLYEVDEATNLIRDQVDEEANIIFGSAFNEELSGSIRVSVVATGIDGTGMEMPIPQPRREVKEEPVLELETPAPKSEPAMEVASAENEVVSADPVVAAMAELGDAVEAAASAPEVSEAELVEYVPEVELSENQQEELAPEDNAEEQEVVASRGMDMFVAAAPMEPKANSASLGKSDPFADADYENGAPKEDVAEAASLLDMPESGSRRRKIMATEQASETPVVPEPAPAKRSLFQMMTSGLLSSDSGNRAATPASNDAKHAELDSVSPGERPSQTTPTDQLEIPSFLRRQQN